MKWVDRNQREQQKGANYGSTSSSLRCLDRLLLDDVDVDERGGGSEEASFALDRTATTPSISAARTSVSGHRNGVTKNATSPSDCRRSCRCACSSGVMS